MQNDKFGRLLKGAINSIASYEHKTATIIEDELGQQSGLSAASIQRYKAGHVPPETSTVQLLAESAVRRGYLNREWLQNFLAAAHHPAPSTLLEQLYPNTAPTQSQPQRVYHNLPAPTYGQFVMRHEAYSDVLDGLNQRSAVVVITSLGGMGKTSLAREVAAHCLQAANIASDIPHFGAVVWISDKDRPGTTSLLSVLDEIARTLDYPGFTQYALPEKRREVEQLLRRQRVLLVVDNFETVRDHELLTWLLRLPEPSKALITTREYRREFQRGGWPVELRGLSAEEALKLIGQRLRTLKIDKHVSDPAQLGLLTAATGGNAKAIEIALGCLKYERQGLPKVLTDLHEARGELFEDLFSRSWALLDEAARKVLLAMPFFADSASAEAIAATSEVKGAAFEATIERLTDLTFLDVQYSDLTQPPRYALHPLVRAFAAAKLAQQPDLEKAMRERWVGWYLSLASAVGYCWNDLSRLEQLDPEQETLQTVINWTLQHSHYAQTMQLTRGVGYFYYIRGLWEKKPPINLIGATAARNLGDAAAETEALAYHVQLLSKQGNLSEVSQNLPRLHQVAKTAAESLSPETRFMYRHTVALDWLLGRHEPEQARQIWQESLDATRPLSPHLYVTARRWLATCLYRQGKWEQAQQLFQEALHDALEYGYKEGQVVIQIQLASLALDQQNFESAARLLMEGQREANLCQYRDHLAQIEFLYARLQLLRGDYEAAGAALEKAIDLFERLGMGYELAQARDQLAYLTTSFTRATN